MSQLFSASSSIRDNHSEGKAGDYLAEQLAPDSQVSIVSAYFTIHAYHALKDKLDQIKHLRFLFGEPTLLASLDDGQKESKAFSLTGKGLDLRNQLQQRKLAKDCADWITRKVDIRSVSQSGFLHGKMYHFRKEGKEGALIGSSNFTVPGLGLRDSGNNVELNLVVDSDRDRADLLGWFDKWWNSDSETQDVKDTVLKELARLYSNMAPEFIYYLTLFRIFKEFIDSKRDTDDDLSSVALPDTSVWQKLYAFQKDGAKAAINKLRDMNGCILADSVGLGKTFTALAVIKYYELKNDRVLVLCPKKLRRNWTIYRSDNTLNPFVNDRFRYDVLSHTDLSRDKGDVDGIELSTLNWGNYDLLVIDESHHFRNNKKARQAPGEEPRQTRYEKLVNEIVEKGVSTKVLLLSATPVNNELSDLRNQISFIAGGDVTRSITADSAFQERLEVRSVKETTRTAQTQFTNWSKQPSESRNGRDLLQAISGDFFKLLDGLSIARSRKQIQTYYRDEMASLGGFPERPPPLSLHPKIDRHSEFISFQQLDAKISELKLALYNPTLHLRDDLPDDIRHDYQDTIHGGFTQEGRERILVSMMKVNYLKRLESSIYSFRKTLSKVIEKIDALDKKIANFEQHQDDNPEVDYDLVTLEDLDDPDLGLEDFTVGGKRKFHLGHIDTYKWRENIHEDREKLQNLLDQTSVITVARDEKLKTLSDKILEKFDQPTTTKDGRKNRKVLIFTAFADTARYLYENLVSTIQEHDAHAALICGDGGNKTTLGNQDYDNILTNFSPISKERANQPQFPQDEEISVLIATDCISEGQNLQDCDLLINYDIHWNPVRIIQRFGRIDRIGSLNKAVHLINFWPVEDLDLYLKVKHRVEARMALVDLSATQTDNLLEDEQLEELITSDLRFRNQQLVRLQDEILDLEDFDDNITLIDFSLDEFRLDLLQYLESKREALEEAGSGLYAVVPAGEGMASPGTIFCLRHIGQNEDKHGEQGNSSAGASDINPLGSYFLIYVRDDGIVRLTFAHPKQALNLMRELAAGKDSPHERLCKLFDARTQDGTDMSHYDGLITKALESIKNTFNRRALGTLFAGRDGMLPHESETPSDQEDEYELVTWLVILK